MDRSAGYTLAELLVALALTLLVVGAVFALVTPGSEAADWQVDALDLQQRARLTADQLLHEILLAGAGMDAGPMTGPLVRYLPPVIPRRIGLQGADPVNTARADVITILYAPDSAAQATIAASIVGTPADLVLEAWPNCPAARALCGLAASDTLVVFDPLGRFDLFSLTSVSGTTGRLQLLGTRSSGPYGAGALMSQAVVRVYWFDRAAGQLRMYDGKSTDTPMTDNVAAVTFEYWGDPQPPQWPKPPPGESSCLYDAAGVLLPLPSLATQGESLALLPLAILSDGPWCGSGSTSFDVDLLRIRRIRVSLRFQTPSAARRAASDAFANSGTARSSLRVLPDQTVTFDVTPRNLNFGR